MRNRELAIMKTDDRIMLVDQGRPVAFSFEDMIGYHGPGSPGGVAHAFKVLERARCGRPSADREPAMPSSWSPAR